METMDEKWKLLYKEPTRAPLYSVHQYVSYLRRFVADTERARSETSAGQRHETEAQTAQKRTPDGIHPLSYFLRKLKLDLKVSYDSFVTEFVRPTNGGLFLLLRLLSNLQNKGTGNGCRTGSANALNRSSSVLENYKQNVTDEHDCILCIKYTMRAKSAVGQLVGGKEGILHIIECMMNANSQARITCLEILTLALLDSRAVDCVVEAFTVMRLRCGESVRFKMLISMLYTKGPAQVLFQVACLKMLNTLLNSCHSANTRVYLQQEVLAAGLDLQLLTNSAQGDGLEYDDLKREIHEWRKRFIDVDTLLKRLRIKTDQRDIITDFFSGPDGPLQVSSRRVSVINGQEAEYFSHQQFPENDKMSASNKHENKKDNIFSVNNGREYISAWQPEEHKHYDSYDVDVGAANDSGSQFISVPAHPPPSIHRKRPPYPYQTHQGVCNQQSRKTETHHTGLTMSALDLRKIPSNRTNVAYDHKHGFTETPSSRDTVVDAYGFVLHAGKVYDDGAQRFKETDATYSNWKLRYFSEPNLVRAVDESGEIQNLNTANIREPDSSPDKFDSGVCLSNEDTQADGAETYYPFRRRALYRGHDLSYGLQHGQQGKTVDPLEQISRASPESTDNKRSETQLVMNSPDPDYSPLITPSGSMRSLGSDVAQVLQDFEKTLHGHDTPSTSKASMADTGPIVYV